MTLPLVTPETKKVFTHHLRAINRLVKLPRKTPYLSLKRQCKITKKINTKIKKMHFRTHCRIFGNIVMKKPLKVRFKSVIRR